MWFAFFGLVLLLACASEPDEKDALVGDWLSGMRIEEALLAPSAAQGRWKFEGRDGLIFASEPNFSLIGASGKLTLLFSDSLLVRVRYQPEDLDSFLAALENSAGYKVVDLDGVRRGNVEIWVWREEPGEESVFWEDSRFREVRALSSD